MEQIIARLLAGCILLVASGSASAAPVVYDIVVYGGTAGGVSAAVQAARMGKSVVLIEPSKHLGGMTSGGLGATDIGNKKAIGGIAREFYRRVRKYYDDPSHWRYEKRSEFKGGGHVASEDTAWTFEPHVAEQIFSDLVREHHVPLMLGQHLDRKKGVQRDGPLLIAITMESGQTYRGKMFIDASYEGDLMALAGVSFHVGREANMTYGETLNGVQVKNATKHQFIKNVDPYVKPGDPSSGLLPRVGARPPGVDGEGDMRVQAYNLRLCATDRPENRRPWPKPTHYDERQYELLLRNFEAGDQRIPWSLLLMPNRKTDCNNNFAFSTDDIGANYGYPNGDYATRDRIVREHLEYTQGLMWTLANHPRVPARIREYFHTWGLAKDEFVDTDNWPHQLYIREARRMIGAYVMTEQNCRGSRIAKDSVGLAAYGMDSHNIQRYLTRDGHVRNEGDVQVGGFAPYPISYSALTPKPEQCGNLLVPVCLSASHIAYGSIRMEPVFMVLGQSAATAAALAIDNQVSVQRVDYGRLRERLTKDGQVLQWTGPRPPQEIDIKTLPGIVVDDDAAERHGFEGQSRAVGPFVGAGYRHDQNQDKGQQWIRYMPNLPNEGRYEVRLAYSPNPNRATNVPITVVHADGRAQVKVNERLRPKLEGLFLSLGTFHFHRGKAGFVEIRNDGTNGFVVADAVQWLPQK